MQTHVVKSGDTLWKIGKKYGVTVEQLAAANNLKGRKIHQLSIDQKILIPGTRTQDPQTKLALNFRGLDFKPVKPAKVKVEHDGGVMEYLMDATGSIALSINDHAQGLKVWIEDMNKQMVPVLDRPILPIGEWKVAIDSRLVKIAGNLQKKLGPSKSTTPTVKDAVTHNAAEAKGATAATQTRTESGKPVHALATIYTEANLRLIPANEQFRKMIIAAASKHALTPQSLAALIDAEAAKFKGGGWNEKSNQSSPELAQGLAQFFKAGWTDVFNSDKSLLHADCQSLGETARLAKRLEAKYAIDGAATYANLNLKNFEQKTKLSVQSLPPEEKAKVAYLLHHEGAKGAARLVGVGEPMDADYAKTLLGKQLGPKNKKQLEALIEQYDDDPVAAYKGWLYSYTDSKINVNHYLVQDAQKFAKAPRTMAAIMGGLSKVAAAPAPAKLKTTPKPKTTPAASTPATTAAAPAAAAVAGDDKWFDPLAVCTLRTAKLASKKSASFGMVRNGGKRAHQGIDLVAVPKTITYAVANGEVRLQAAANRKAGYGDCLILIVGVNDLPPAQAAAFKKVNPGRDTIGFFYAHLNKYLVKDKALVDAGTPIAETGSTGNADGMTTVATGAHLHFEVRKDAMLRSTGLSNRVDPMLFIQNCTNR